MKKQLIGFHLLNNFTGSPQVFQQVLLLAKERGFEISLFTSKTEGFLSELKGIKFKSNHYKRSNHRILTLFSFFLSQLFICVRLLKYKKVDCVFYINTILPFSAIIMGRLLGKKVIVHVHEYEISPRLLNRFLFWVVRTFADQILAVSKFLSQNPSLFPRDAKIIHNTVKADFENQRFFSPKKREEFRVLMLASLRAYKGVNEYLQLAEMLPKLEFDLILSDSQEEVNQWTQSLTVPPNVLVLPMQKQVIPWYQNSSLIVNLSHKDKVLETFGMTILEGMYFGLPAIVPTQGGVEELVENGVNGYKIDYTELEKIAEVIGEISSNVELWEKLSQGACQKANDFSRDRFNKRLEEVLVSA